MYVHICINTFIWDVSIVKDIPTLFSGFEMKPMHCSFFVGNLYSDTVKHRSCFFSFVFYIYIYVESD